MQFGQNVHDCVGLIKGYLWRNEKGTLSYQPSQDKDVSGMLKKCSVQGHISAMPEIKGILVFMSGHVGIYIGNGEVIEARGHKYGVVKTKLANRPWTRWGKLDWINYIEEEEEEDMQRFNSVEEVPEYAKETIQKLIDKKLLNGNENGLNLSEDMIRMFVINDRAGIYEN